MNLKKRSVKITIYTFIALIISLFFIFLATYDFVGDKKNDKSYTIENLSNDFEHLLYNEFDNSLDFKMLNVFYDNDFIFKFCSALNNRGNESKLDNDYVRLVNYNFKVKRQNFVLALHFKNKKGINFQFKINMVFSFKETDSQFILTLKRASYGAIPIPIFFLREALKPKPNRTVGRAVYDTLSNIGIGTYDYNNLTFTIEKSELTDSVKRGIIGDTIYHDKDMVFKKTASIYIGAIFENKLETVEANNGVNMRVDYTKLLSNDETLESLIDDEIKGDEYKKYISEILFEHLLVNDYIELDDYHLTSLLRDKLSSYLNKELEAKRVLNFYINDVIFTYKNGVLNITFGYRINTKKSALSINFTNVNNLFKFKDISIGKDASEDTSDYISIYKTSDVNQVLSLLSDLGIEVDTRNNTLSLYSIINYVYNIKEISSTSDSIKIRYENNDYQNEIIDCLKSNEFLDSLSDETRSDFYNSSLEYIISSYNDLTYQERVEILDKMIEYFDSRNIEVKNYILSLIK